MSEIPSTVMTPKRPPSSPTEPEKEQDSSTFSAVPTLDDLAQVRTVAIGFLDYARWMVRVLISSLDRFYWDDGFSRAASLAYTSLLSLVPVTVLGFGILASFAISGEFISEVRGFIFKQFVPDDQFVNEVLVYIQSFSEAVSQLNVVFILFLVITSLLLINSVEYALNATWQVFEPRPISQRIAIFSAIVLISPVLLLSVYYFYEKVAVSELLREAGTLQKLYLNSVPIFIDFSAFVMLYWLVPKAPVKLESAFFGALIAAVLFNIAKVGYAEYLRDFASYNTLYKSIAAIPISLVWLYLAWIILLFGAEASYQFQYLPRGEKLWKRSVLSVGDARMMLAVQSLVIIYRAFASGQRMPNDIELAEILGCSSVVLKPVIDSLEKKQIVARGDSRDMPIALLRSPEKITLEEIRKALFGDRSSIHFAGEMERLFKKLAGQPELSKVTLDSIVKG